MCVAQPENSDEPVYASCLELEELVRLTRALLQPELKPKPDAVIQTETAPKTNPEENEDEAGLYFNRKR